MPQVRQDKKRKISAKQALGLGLAIAVMIGFGGPSRTETVGADLPESFSVCEETTDDNGGPRPECQAGDIRFQADIEQDGQFGFSMASGHLNGDGLEDLVVGDPIRNRVYIFFGRLSSMDSYGLFPEDLLREVSSETGADVILQAASPGQIGYFGYSVAIGRQGTEEVACAPDDLAFPLIVGAPGVPGTAGDPPGRAFYFPAGSLCMTPTDPPTPTTIDPLTIGQAIGSPVIEEDDEFGYSVALGRLLTNTGTDEDVIVGARLGGDGGKVAVFPVTDGVVGTAGDEVVQIEGLAGDGLGEVLAVGDLDGDFEDLEPFGNLDDLAIGAVGHESGKVVVIQGPLDPDGGVAGDGVYSEELDPRITPILGEASGDFFGFSVAIGGGGRLAVGAIFADNTAPAGEGAGGDPATNVPGPNRLNAGKVYVWNQGTVFVADATERPANSAALVLVARRSGDQLGFAVDFGDLDSSGDDDLIVTARREDASGLKIDVIDQGTAYVIFDDTTFGSPVDLNQCVATSDCTGVAGIDVMIFGGDRTADGGDEIGYASATGDFNGDAAVDLFLSSLTHDRVYVVTLEDTDDDRELEGRNIRDDDDDNDGDPDGIDCDPLDPDVDSAAEEIPCNGVDENCNGMDDDTPDVDEDGFDACGDDDTDADCDDDDPFSYPGATELCDGNDNDCDGAVPSEESDIDEDGYVGCEDWNDIQGDDPGLIGGDCGPADEDTFPGAAQNEEDTEACMRDADDDGYGAVSPAEGVTPGTDCDDGSPATFPGAAELEDDTECMRDVDDDGHGDADPPEGVTAGDDCDDADAASYAGAPEACDGNDNNCDESVPVDEVDNDDDGYVACGGWVDTQADDPDILGGDDCSAGDEDTFPGAAPNESTPTACMRDADGDGFGDQFAERPVFAGTDCDDASMNTFPGAAPLDDPNTCMKDNDDDDYGDSLAVLPVVDGSDCNDEDENVSSGAAEIPNDDIDQDCNGFDTISCFVDDDGDGFGSSSTLLADDGDCDDEGEADVDGDCDDDDDTIFPGQTETPDDGIDQDCNTTDTVTCFVDDDGDSFGSTSAETTLADDGSCDAEQQESSTDDDCDDGDANTYPGAPDQCDGNVNDCSGGDVSTDETDGDGDLYVECSGWEDTQGDNPTILGGGDCDDTRSTTFPGAAENESVPGACRKDADGDGFGDLFAPAGVVKGTDCADDGPFAADTYPGAASIDGPENCMKDSDGDEYGDANVDLPVVDGSDCDDEDPGSFLGAPELCDGNDNSCAGFVSDDELDLDTDLYVVCSDWVDPQGDQPAILGGDDCDDADTDTFPGAAWKDFVPTACMTDRDGDDYGDQTAELPVIAGTDCDDDSITTFPGAAAIDGPDNCMKDTDDDDYGDSSSILPVVPGGDCDDGNAAKNPGTFEGPMGDPLCADGLDNDCDGLVDDDDPVCTGDVLPCPDMDEDDFADCDSDPTCDFTGMTCGDCDDDDATVNPLAAEICDNQDNDCNGETDELFDGDDDGFSTCSVPVADCDDDNPLINPGAIEICQDMLDNDCDAATPDLFDGDEDGATCDVDCDDDDALLNLDDGDKDGFSTCDGDCNDDDFDVNPGVAEVCEDTIDNDCDPGTPDLFDGDEDGATCDIDCDDNDATANLDDVDEDGFTSCAGDCNDDDPNVNPAEDEICDGVDNNCDGAIDELFDLDEDGYSPCSLPIGDCDETEPLINPGADEVCNDMIDNDCNEGTPDVVDADQDGATCIIDCDENDPNTFPGAAESCDGNDNDCAGGVPADEIDDDSDTFVECGLWIDTQGDNPEIAGGGDCDDTDLDTYPGAAPNESIGTACMTDKDGDDYGDLLADPPVVKGTDCDDDSASTFLGAAMIDGPDNCMKDADDDDYGDAAAELPVVFGTDCNDDNADVNPAGTEGPPMDPVCSDLLDNDCDSFVDEADADCAGGGAAANGKSGQSPGKFRTSVGIAE